MAILVVFALHGVGTAIVVPASAQEVGIWAEIRVIDAATGRGIPLVELETVNNLQFVTDNAGRIAFHEPGLMDRELFFYVRSHGYEAAKDGFGYAGARLTPRAGETSEIQLTRTNLAERLCRLTGEGLYRDSLLLGHQTPPLDQHPGRVAGQDSIQATVHRGKIYWFWGDTLRMEHPLGIFRMAGATTPLFSDDHDFSRGIAFDYFVDPQSKFARNMMPLPERPEGVIWVHSVFTVPDEHGIEKLVGHYSRRKGLRGEYEHGIAVFNDEEGIFESAKQLPLSEKWRRPSGHPILFEEGGTRWVLFGTPNPLMGSPTPNVRVPATLKDVLDESQYEAFTCASQQRDGAPTEPMLDEDGHPVWRWQKELPPVHSATEAKWVAAGRIQEEHTRFLPMDVASPDERITLHSGSVRWNEHRQRWVLVAGQIQGGPSMLGEVWYSEADHPTGPFVRAVRVVTHNRQTFYNVCHHPFLDREGGRFIHFEGTYTNEFSGNPEQTPRYNYNQILYRLDLEDERLRPVQMTESAATEPSGTSANVP